MAFYVPITKDLPSPPPLDAFKFSPVNRLSRNHCDMTSRTPPPTKLTGDFDKDSVIKLLECPVCLLIPVPPINMCQKGHNVCEICRRKLVRCPICQSEFTDTRNYLAESLVEKLNSKCQNAKEGCTANINVKNWESHVVNCPFRQVECNLENPKKCQHVMINYSNYLNHLMKVHKVVGVKGAILNVAQFCTFEQGSLGIDMPTTVWPVQYLEACNQVFLTATSIYQEKIHWWIYIIGSDELAQSYTCKISLQNKSEGLEMTWVGPVHSFRVPEEDIQHKGMCLLMTKDNFPTFTNVRLIDTHNMQAEWILTFVVGKKQRPLPVIPTVFTIASHETTEVYKPNQYAGNKHDAVHIPARSKSRVKNCLSVGNLSIE